MAAGAALAADQHEVAGINDEAEKLAGNEHRVKPVDGMISTRKAVETCEMVLEALEITGI